MATDITIKRYDGSNWVELNPATSISQVSGLQSALDTLTTNKQDKSNLVTSVSSSSTDAQYPSAKLFYDTTTGIMETAEGKTASYVSGVYKDSNDRYYLAVGAVGNPVASGTPVLSPEVTKIEITGSTSFVDISQYEYLYILDSTGRQVLKSVSLLAENLKSGDVLLLIPTDLPDFWFNVTEDGTFLYKLETTKVDLSNYITTNTTQTGLTGNKTFDGSTFTFVSGNLANKFEIDYASIIGYMGNQGTVLLSNNGGGLHLYGITGKNSTTYGYGEIIVGGSATLTLPTTTGTLALTSDLTPYALKDSPTFTGTVELPTTTKITGITSTGNVRYANGVLSVDTTSYVPTTRTVNGKALSSDITLSASDVSALPSNTAYLASAGLSSDSRTLTITPSSGSAISFDSGNVTTLNTTAPTSSKTGDIWFQTSA